MRGSALGRAWWLAFLLPLVSAVDFSGERRKHHRHRHRYSVPQEPLIAHAHTPYFHHLLNHARSVYRGNKHHHTTTRHSSTDLKSRKNSRSTSFPADSALATMARIAARVLPASNHPALHEIQKVAKELLQAKDEPLAEATLPTFHDSLVKLAGLLKQEDRVKTSTKAVGDGDMTMKTPNGEVPAGKTAAAEDAAAPAGGGASDMVQDMRADVCGAKPELHQPKCEAFMKQYCAEKPESQPCKNFFQKDEEEKVG